MNVDLDLLSYWTKIFPFATLDLLLTMGNTVDFNKREIATTFSKQQEGQKGPKTFMQRNKAFESFDKLMEYIKSQANDGWSMTRMEFGPVFPTTDRKESRGEDMPRRVELRFDVDITDWNSFNEFYGVECFVCDHFDHSFACKECWTTRLEPSRKVLAYLLEEMYGVEHVLWVFSGKKGYHGIVLDKEYRVIMSKETREFMFNQLVNPSDPKIHDHVYINILWPIFKEQYLSDSKRQIPVKILKQGLKEHRYIPSGQKEAMKYICENIFRKDPKKIEQYYRGMMRTMYWPRLDAPVSNDNHLLKIPFSVHDGTKNISTPILDPDTFLPENALKLSDVSKDTLQPYKYHCNALFKKAFRLEEEDGFILNDSSIEKIEEKKRKKKKYNNN